MQQRVETLTGQIDKHQEDLEDQQMNANALEDQLKGKVEKFEITKIWIEFKRYAFYEDFKDLYQKTVVPMQKFEQEMLDFGKGHKQMEQMIKRFDENLALKSNKKDVWKIENDLVIYATKGDVEQVVERSEEEAEKVRLELEKQREVIEGLQANMQTTVFEAVKKAKRSIEKSME